MARRATVYDVAERAGVSIATVSYAFRQPDRVRESTRERILAAAQDLGYVPNANARGLARGKTNALGLYSFDLMLDAPQGLSAGSRAAGAGDDVEVDLRAFPLYVDEIQRGFELECWHRDQTLLLSSGTGPETSRVTDLAGRVDGLAVFPGPLSDESLQFLSRRLPILVFSREPSDVPLFHLGVDNYAGMRSLVDHLVLVHHVRDIMFVGALDVPEYRQRFEGYVSGLAAHGIPAPGRPLDESDLGRADNLASLREAVADGALPRAVMCASDQLALAVLDLLEDKGVRVPQDVLVTGFDGILAGRLSAPTLTTVRQPMEAMGRFAAQVLVDNGGQRWTSPQSRSFPVRLVVRDSCGCGRAGTVGH